jgi:hypothetical protein
MSRRDYSGRNIAGAMLINELGVSPRMPDVGLFVHGEERDSARVIDPIVSLEAVDLRRCDCGNLRLVGVNRREADGRILVRACIIP